jgi:outer membrane protein OmpA-like peptidoglycan-associated protein
MIRTLKVAVVGVFISLLLFSCNNKGSNIANAKNILVIRFLTDTAGNITDSAVIKQLTTLAAYVDSTADRIVLCSYTEKKSTKQEELALAAEQANAAKNVMLHYERVYYNVGIDAKGYENPIDALYPSALINRRIEVELP